MQKSSSASSKQSSIQALLDKPRLFGQTLDRFPRAVVSGKKTTAWSQTSK